MLLDWVSFTVWEQTVQEVAEAILCLPAEDFLHTELNIRGFRDNYEFIKNKGISIATNGLPEQGIHVTITGQGCSFLFSYTAIFCLRDFSIVKILADEKSFVNRYEKQKKLTYYVNGCMI